MTSKCKWPIKNISGNIEQVFFKLGTRNVHHKRTKCVVSLPWKLSWLCFLSVKKQSPHFQPLMPSQGAHVLFITQLHACTSVGIDILNYISKHTVKMKATFSYCAQIKFNEAVLKPVFQLPAEKLAVICQKL